MDSPWPMQSHDISHTGQSTYSTEDNNGVELWKFKTIGRMMSGIAIDTDGMLYFGDYDWYLYSVYPNGTLNWRVKLSGGVWSTPALAADGTIYIGSIGHDFYAFNPNGTLKWSFDASGTIVSSPAIAPEGTIYFGTMSPPDQGYRVYALNPDGTLKWYYQTGDVITSAPAIGTDGTVYIGSCDHYLYALNPNGTLKWKYKTGDEIHGNPTIGPDGTIYIGSNDHYFYALYQNGTLKWRYKINSSPYSNAAIGADGTIYCPDHSIYAFNPDGTTKWIFDFEDNLGATQSAPAISKEGTIYIGLTRQGGQGGTIIAINPDGTEQWRKEISNYGVDSSPAIGADGTVYIGATINDYPNGEYGYVYAFGEGNNPPETPRITGPQNGKKGETYTYTFETTDQDNEDIYYYVDWGDGTNTGWLGPYQSGTELTLAHTWMFQGTYPLKAKAKDEQGKESNWATLEVTMPKNHQISFIQWINYHFPYLNWLPL